MNAPTVRSVAGLCRVPGAPEALSELLAARRDAPFAWGVHDCCLFAADAIRAQIGADPAESLRGRYATALQAQRVIALCGGSLAAIATAALGPPLQHALLACSGDVGLVRAPTADDDSGEVLAVCLGEWWQVPARDGLALRPLTDGLMAWRVGCG